MDIELLLKDKASKAKEKTETLSQWLLQKDIVVEELVNFAQKAKDPIKATCIEALEFASKEQASLVDSQTFQFLISSLQSKAPRVKWESAKVIGHVAKQFSEQLDDAIKYLIVNTADEGTVVRWSAAFALGEILKLKSPYNKELLPTIEGICEREEKNSIKKIYLDAIKKLKKA